MKELNKEEKSLLLYFETCAVDSSSRVAVAHMNKEDIEIAKKWNEEGFVEFGRISGREILSQDTPIKNTHYVILSDEAWKLAHLLRRERGERNAKRLLEATIR